MHRRLNITLPEDVLARADAFAKRKRYTRSALIADALETFVAGKTGAVEYAREPGTGYATRAAENTLESINPRVRPHVDAIVESCRRHGARKVALVGSATQPDASVVPADLDIVLRFDPTPTGYAERYFGLLAELERIMDMPVEIIEEDALRNPYLRDEFTATQVVLYEAA